MRAIVLLCADSECLKNPELIGLPEENLLGESWLLTCSDAVKARSFARSCSELSEIWVISSDSVGGINLAAALKRECYGAKITLVSNEKSGSFVSRSKAAGADEVITQVVFNDRYYSLKEKHGAAFRKPAIKVVDQTIVNKNQTLVSAINPQLKRQSREDLRTFSGSLSEESFELEEPDVVKERTRYPPVNSELLSARSSRIKTDDCYVLSFVSGSGGCGKSTLSVMSALLSQKQGFKTLLFDADFQFGDAHYLLGKRNSMSVTELMEHPEKIKNLESNDGLPALLSAPKKVEDSELVVKRLKELLQFLRGHFEVIVVNTGALWTEEQIRLLEASNQSVFVIDQRPSSVRACAHALDLCSRCGVAVQSFVYTLNFCSKQALLTSLDVSCALRGVRVFEIRDGGKDVVELLGAGVPFELLDSRNPLIESLNLFLASTLYDARNPKKVIGEPRKRKPQTGRLFRKRKRVACL